MDVGHDADVRVREPACSLRAADPRRAGADRRRQPHRPADVGDRRSCYAARARHRGASDAVGRTDSHPGRLGRGADERPIGDDGNAALALNLLGAQRGRCSGTPSSRTRPGRPTAAARSPTCCRSGWARRAASSSWSCCSLALWRGRRLGPVVDEPLPVVVRAAETTEGRARLYRRAEGARTGPPSSLRAATRPRLLAAARAAAGQRPTRPWWRRWPPGRGPAAGPTSPTSCTVPPPHDDAAPGRRWRPPSTRWRGRYAARRAMTDPQRAPTRATARAAPCSPLRGEVAKAVVGQDAAVSGLVVALLVPRARAARGRARHRPRRCWSARWPPRSTLDSTRRAVHPRPDARRRHRLAGLRRAHGRVPLPRRARSSPTCCSPTRSTARRPRPRRRCSRRWRSGRSRSTACRAPLPDPFIVARHAEPGRVRGHLPAARGPARPVPVQADGPLPDRATRRSPSCAGTPPGSTRTTSPAAGRRARSPGRPTSPPAARAVRARCRSRPRSSATSSTSCRATRQSPSLRLGVSPRGATALLPRRGPGRGCPDATSSRPTTSRRWPSRRCATASSCGPRPSSRASTADGVLDGSALGPVPVPR